MSRRGKNNHYHYAEKYETKRYRRRMRARDMLYTPVKPAMVALLVLFAFGLISTTFAAYVTNNYDSVVDESSGSGIVMNIRNRKVNDDTLAYTAANSGIADTGANVDVADTGARTGYYITGTAAGAWGTFTQMTTSAGGYYCYYRTNLGTSPSDANCAFVITDSGNYNTKYNNTSNLCTDGFWSSGAFQHADNKWFWRDSNGDFHIKDAGQAKPYVVVYYPNTELNSNNYPLVCGYRSLPDDVPTYSVKNNFAQSTGTSETFTTTALTASDAKICLTTTYTGNFVLSKASQNYRFQIVKQLSSAYTSGGNAIVKYFGMNNSTISQAYSAYDLHTDNDYCKFASPAMDGTTVTFTVTDNPWSDTKVSLNNTYPSVYTVTVNQYKGSSGTNGKTGTVTVGSTSITSSANTANVLGGSATSISITPPTGYYIYATSNPSASSGTLTRTSGQTGTSSWTGTLTTTANSTLTIRYIEWTKAVTINTNKPGTVATNTSTVVPSSFASSTSVTVGTDTTRYVFAKPNTGFEFKEWSYTSGTILLSGDTALTGTNAGTRCVQLKGNGTDSAAATLQAVFQLKKPTGTTAGYASYGFTGTAMSPTSTATSATGTAPASWSFEYRFTSKPAGSSATINASNGGFTPDVPGTYTVGVKATDSQTVSGTTFTRQGDEATQSITVYQSPTLSLTVTAEDTSSVEGSGLASGDPYIMVINQPLTFSTTLSDYNRTQLTYQWSKDGGTTWDADPTDENDDYTNVYEFSNVNTLTGVPDQYVSTTAASTGNTFTIKCKASLTSDATKYTIVDYTFYYNVSSEILRIDDIYFMEDKGNGMAKYTTPHQLIYPENSAALAVDVTYGGTTFDTVVQFSKDLTDYTEIYRKTAGSIVYRFFHFNPSSADEIALDNVYTNYTAKPGVKSFKVSITDDQSLVANAGPFNTVVGTREVAGAKSVYFYTGNSLATARNVVLFYYKDGEWHFQNGQYVSANYYRFNIPADVSNVLFAVAKNTNYGLPTFSGGECTFNTTYYSAWTSSAVTFTDGNPKFTATISGTSITGSVGSL